MELLKNNCYKTNIETVPRHVILNKYHSLDQWYSKFLKAVHPKLLRNKFCAHKTVRNT